MTLWERRDLPVLRALATTDNEDVRQGYLHLSSEQERPLGLDLTTREVYDALLTLDDAGYIEGQFQRQAAAAQSSPTSRSPAGDSRH
jgi:hypothetical protein